MKRLVAFLAVLLFSSGAYAGMNNPASGTIAAFVQTSPVTIANTTTETAMFSAGVGSLVLPANALSVGKTLKLWMMGRRSASGNPTERLQLKLNGVTILDTGVTTSGSATNEVWEARALLTVRSVGTSGSAGANGFYMEQSGSGTNDIFGMINTVPISINTTTPQTMSATWTWGTASAADAITISNVVIEIMG